MRTPIGRYVTAFGLVVGVSLGACSLGVRFDPVDRDATAQDASASVSCASSVALLPSPSCADGTPHCSRLTIALPERWAVGPNSAADSGTYDASGGRVLTLDAHEVSVGRYRAFLAAEGHLLEQTASYPDGSRLTVMAGPPRDDDDRCSLRSGDDALPMNCVGWAEAQAFCAWDGGRLPTLAEIEFVRRWWDRAEVDPAGAAGRAYPWGDDSASSHFSPYPDSLPANRFPTPPPPRVDALAIGCVYGIAGGVAEWLGDALESGGPVRYDGPCFHDGFCEGRAGDGRAVATGSWADSDEDHLRSSAVITRFQDDRLFFIGFRCAYDV